MDPPPPCNDDSQCQNDTYCAPDGGGCIPYGVGPRDGGYNPTCKRLAALGLFAPRPQCEWSGPEAGDPYPNHKNVLSTPLVMDFDFDNDKNTLKPSIVFNSYNCDDGDDGVNPGCYGVIRVIDGQTCKTQFSVGGTGGDTFIIGSVTPAIGDLDGDKRPDIVVERRGGGVMGYRYTPGTGGTRGSWGPIWTSYSTFNAGGGHWDSLSLHDLDDDGVPEIVQNGPYPAAYDNKGVLIHGAPVLTDYAKMQHPVLADLNGDGKVEMVDGKNTLTFDPATRRWVTQSTDNDRGQAAVGDFGTFPVTGTGDDRGTLDGVPELVVVTYGWVRVQTLTGRVVFGPIAIPGGGNGGPPTVADFDGDGRVEIGVAGALAYAVFDPDCRAGADAKLCASGSTNGVLWSQTAQDKSSSMTGSSVFDFDGDGKAEVVYADECFSRVYDGRSGTVLFSQYHTSCTWYENPVVADVDGDFRSEIVIPSNSNCGVTCPAVDPIHRGVACDTDAECLGTTKCVREQAGDRFGLCRCSTTSDCASPSLVCVDPVGGPSSNGRVCRASHPKEPPQQGVLVMADVQDRWVPSRPVWNQHAYAVTNVNDDGTIPRTSQWRQNWKDPKLNNFRTNVQGALDPGNVPDLTAGQAGSYTCESGGAAMLQTRICNRGTGPVASGEPVTFYAGPKSEGNVICTVQTKTVLNPGGCELVQCVLPDAVTRPVDVYVVADDDGTGQGTTSECEEANNLGSIRGVNCAIIR